MKVYKENEKIWISPYKLIVRKGEMCMIKINGRLIRFRIIMIKSYHRDEMINLLVETGKEELILE